MSEQVRFLCGASYPLKPDSGWEGYVKKGRIELRVLDTEDTEKTVPPKLYGDPAPCLDGCETRKYRRESPALSKDGSFSGRKVVNCSGVHRAIKESGA